MKGKTMLRIALLFGLLSCLMPAQAEIEHYNRVDFQVEAAREVANDLLIATLNADIQEAQPAEVAKKLNGMLNAALKQAAAFSNVKTSSGTQNTYPVYGKNRQIIAWRGHGQIRLESRDFKAAGELIMQLQASLQLGNVQFAIAPDTRKQIENTLITEAILAFQQRAEAIRGAVGSSTYKTVHFSIQNNGSAPNYPVRLMRSAAMESDIPAPEFAGGETRMTVQINGTIELQ